MELKTTTFNPATGETTVEDNRTVAGCSQRKIDYIKKQCQSAITATGLSWMVEREFSGGEAISQEVKDLCAEYRSKSNLLEGQVNELAQDANNNDKSVCDSIDAILWN